MKTRTGEIVCGLFVALGAITLAVAAPPKAETRPVVLTFAGTEYVHRWSKDDQHEFTPYLQEDLRRWTDMITVNYIRGVKDGDGLAASANAVFENYKKNQAIVVKTDSVPRTPEKAAEYLIVVIFPQPEFIETVFARFKLHEGLGSATIYSRREYGKNAGDRMSAWLQKNGPAVEKTLLAWDQIPSPASPPKL